MYIMQDNNLPGATDKRCTVSFEGSLPKASVLGFLEDNNTCKVFVGTPVDQFDGLITNGYQPNNSYTRIVDGEQFDCTAPKNFTPIDPDKPNSPGFGPVGNDGKITNEFSCVRKP